MDKQEQSIKRVCIDAINILIINDSNTNIDQEKLICIVVDSLNIKDVKTGKKLYSHLNELAITKNIFNYKKANKTNIRNISDNINIHDINEQYDLTSNTYDTLIINSSNRDNTTEILKKYINIITTKIVIVNSFNYEISFSNWNAKNFSTNTVITYHNEIYDNNIHKNICNYYELLHIINNVINTNNFFLIKSSCLGCVRNRSHIVFCDKIHICMNRDLKESVIKMNGEFSRYNIHLIDNKNENFIILKLKNIAMAKIHFYDIVDDLVVIRDNKEQSISLDDMGNLKKYNYGPIRVKSLEHPSKYLKSLYGNDVFSTLRHNDFEIKIPKYLYDCYYNQWSSYTSDYWKKQQIENLYRVYSILKNNNIKCWIDCGTLLGAARNNFICLFDDDTDIGIFEKDAIKVSQILNSNNISCQKKIHYVNKINYEEYYNMKISHNGKENINYTFFSNLNLLCEFRSYVKDKNKYVSKKDRHVSNAHRVPGLMEKRAVDTSHFDNLSTIKLGQYTFDCPSNYKKYLESESRYGKGSINGNPIRDCKPGIVVLYDDFM